MFTCSGRTRFSVGDLIELSYVLYLVSYIVPVTTFLWARLLVLGSLHCRTVFRCINQIRAKRTVLGAQLDKLEGRAH